MVSRNHRETASKWSALRWILWKSNRQTNRFLWKYLSKADIEHSETFKIGSPNRIKSESFLKPVVFR